MIRTVQLAWADLRHEGRLAIVNVLALSAIIAPLMILFGLKSGMIDSMSQHLLSDPLVLEVIPVGSGSYDASWFRKVAAWPEVAFVCPQTRSIAASVIVEGGTGGKVYYINASLVPTAQGDPLLGAAGIKIPGPGEAVVSNEVGQRLGLHAGDTLRVVVRRILHDKADVIRRSLRVAAVAPAGTYDLPAIWTEFSFLYHVEQFRDGIAVKTFGTSGEPPPAIQPPYISFRMYARNLTSVGKLRDKLIALHIEVHTESGRIEAFLRLSRNLNLLFWLIASVAIIGLVLALGTNLWAGVERKRATLSLIHLLGLKKSRLAGFPLTQAIVLTVGAYALSAVFFLICAVLINSIYSSGQGPQLRSICSISAKDISVGLIILIGLALASSSVAARSVLSVEPTEGLRSAD